MTIELMSLNKASSGPFVEMRMLLSKSMTARIQYRTRGAVLVEKSADGRNFVPFIDVSDWSD